MINLNLLFFCTYELGDKECNDSWYSLYCHPKCEHWDNFNLNLTTRYRDNLIRLDFDFTNVVTADALFYSMGAVADDIKTAGIMVFGSADIDCEYYNLSIVDEVVYIDGYNPLKEDFTDDIEPDQDYYDNN